VHSANVCYVYDMKDFGQKLHETINCGVCSMTYVHREPVDELTHSQYHRKVLATLKFTVSCLGLPRRVIKICR